MSTFRQKVQATTNWVQPDPEDQDQPAKASLLGKRARPAAARKARPAPVTAHRLFPVFAALWFAALFGFGSLAIPSSGLGKIVMLTGLPALVPAAAPPLGFTAHLLVAFALAALGAALGLAVALRLRPKAAGEVRPVEVVVPPVAEPEAEDGYKVRARDAHPDAPPRRPLVLTEAFGDAPTDAPADPVVSLDSSAEPETPLLRRKPDYAASDAEPWIPEFTPGGVRAVRPLDLAALNFIDPVGEPAPFAEPELAPVPEALAIPEAEAPIEAAAEAEPVPERKPETAAVPQAPALIAATPQLPAGFSASLPDVSDGNWSPVAAAPLDSLGIVQLIERLALAIAARKAAGATAPAEPEFAQGPFSMPQTPSAASEAQPAVDAAAAGSARETILRRLGAMAAGALNGEAEPSVPQFSRPTTPAPMAEAVVPLRPAEHTASAFSTSAAPQGNAGAAPAGVPFETDEALRTALATLQRMTVRG